MSGKVRGLSIAYERLDEAEMRLNGTVVLYDGEPVYINRVAPSVGDADGKGDVFRVYAVPLPLPAGGVDADEEFRRYISSRKFDLTTIKLGFINLTAKTGNKTTNLNSVIYLSRKPARQFKQGLCNNTLNALPIHDPMKLVAIGGTRLNNLLNRKEFVDCIKGNYPSFDRCLEEIRGNREAAMAFNREYALVSDDDLDDLIYLYYKEDKVGFVGTDNRVRLSTRTRCLREPLQELNVVVV